MSTYSSDPALDYDLSVDGGIDVATCCFGTDVRLIVRGGCGRLQPEEAQAVGEALLRAAADCRLNAAWARGDQDEPHPNEIPLAAAEASCGGCGCAERLRREARDLAAVAQECIEAGNERVAKIADSKSVGHFCAADFLDAAPDARGSDLSAEQPAPVSEQGHAKKLAEWNDPKEATDG